LRWPQIVITSSFSCLVSINIWLLHQGLADELAGLYIAINGAGFNLYSWQHVIFTKHKPADRPTVISWTG